jgi:peptidoglycan/LPS O-acetylase OafA/YrhL
MAPETSPSQSATFRPDIQALRAIAVSAVVGYHLWPAEIPGGFVGVDVFFVISGFLITRQLAGELARSGRISLTRFWARRIRRLLPAAFTVLAASLLGLFLLMPRVTWAGNLLEIRAAGAYYENWLLGRHAVDYLAAENSPSLVQHYWSLSVEEQFYLVWPFLLLLAVGAGRLVARLGRRRALRAVLVVAAVASFVVSVRMTATNAPMAFFATQTRGWEFAAGGLVAIGGTARHAARRHWSRSASAWVGLALVVWTCLAGTGGHAFPGWIAILPVGGAALLLAADSAGARWSPMRLAHMRPVQWVGDTSYAIYLWHWPLIIAAPWVLHRQLSPLDKVGIAALSLLLAAVTKVVVEDPIRTGARWRSRPWPAYAFAAVGVLALVLTTTVSYVDVHRQDLADVAAARARASAALAPPTPTPSSTGATSQRHVASTREVAPRSCFGAAAILPVNHCPHPFARPAGLDTTFAKQDGTGYDCLQPTDATTPILCTFGRTRSPTRTVVVVGNSHARRLIPALDLYGKQHGWKIVLAAEIDCMGLTTQPTSVQPADDPCLVWSARLQHRLLTMRHLDAVIFASHVSAKHYLAGAGAGADDVRTTSRRIVAAWTALARRGVRVMVTEDVPGMRPAQDPECIAMSDASNDPCSTKRSSVVKPNYLTDLARQHPELVSYLPLHQYFCDSRRCHGLIGGVVVYFDSHHITTTFSRSMAPYFGAQVSAALSSTR